MRGGGGSQLRVREAAWVGAQTQRSCEERGGGKQALRDSGKTCSPAAAAPSGRQRHRGGPAGVASYLRLRLRLLRWRRWQQALPAAPRCRPLPPQQQWEAQQPPPALAAPAVPAEPPRGPSAEDLQQHTAAAGGSAICSRRHACNDGAPLLDISSLQQRRRTHPSAPRPAGIEGWSPAWPRS